MEAAHQIHRGSGERPYLHAISRGAEAHASATDRQMIESTNAALTLFGAKWKVDVLYLLAAGVHRRHVLHDHLLVSKRVLTEVLRALERDGLVHRQVRDEAPIRVDYSLTPLGRSLTAPLFALYEWSEKHMDRVHSAREAHDTRCEWSDGESDGISGTAPELRAAG
jgi:DNA-binding HxlR family transcriptional regulator